MLSERWAKGEFQSQTRSQAPSDRRDLWLIELATLCFNLKRDPKPLPTCDYRTAERVGCAVSISNEIPSPFRQQFTAPVLPAMPSFNLKRDPKPLPTRTYIAWRKGRLEVSISNEIPSPFRRSYTLWVVVTFPVSISNEIPSPFRRHQHTRKP